MAKYKLKVKFLKDEYWYGGSVSISNLLPIRKFKPYYINDTRNRFFNQSSPFFVSSKGRYVWSDDGFKTCVLGNKIIFKSSKSEIKLYDGYKTLKGAFLAASNAHFKANGMMPHETKFTKPQYCTWVELLDDQNQKDIINYSKSIIDSGMPAGEIIIDDSWQKDFGYWEFKESMFSDPKKMVDELKEMGFSVSLWICPFISKEAPDFEYLKKNNALVRDGKTKEIVLRKWWNGKSYVLDLTNDVAVDWFCKQCQNLIDKYGIQGFKQDAGDALYYRDNDLTTKPIDANGQTVLWARLAHKFNYNELRAGWKCGGEGIAQRLMDKLHNWLPFIGLRALIPGMLNLGIIGHPYSCADMVGGGQEFDFQPGKKYDYELFVRSAQCSALLPMMQYSKSIWNLDNKEISQLCVKAANLHAKYADYILKLANEAKTTCEPIVRYMEYQYPGEGFEKDNQQFALGDKYIVAPVVYKRKKYKKVALPKGFKWKELTTNSIYEGGQKIKIEVPIDMLPVFEKQ